MKILVTGATGFVGSHLLKKLDKYEVSILSRKKIPINGVNVFVGDLFDKKILLGASKVDVVIHLAGSSEGNVYKINYEGTKSLIDACRENKVKKLIFISSYDAILNTEYGKSKLKAEDYLKNSGLNYIIFRPTVIYGRDNKKDLGKIISLIKFGIATIPSDGNFKLQPLFIDDIVSLILKSVESKSKNKTYFIGGGDALTFNDVVKLISDYLGRKVIKIRIPGFLVNLRNKTLLNDKICSNLDVEKDFNFHPRKFEDTLKEIL